MADVPVRNPLHRSTYPARSLRRPPRQGWSSRWFLQLCVPPGSRVYDACVALHAARHGQDPCEATPIKNQWVVLAPSSPHLSAEAWCVASYKSGRVDRTLQPHAWYRRRHGQRRASRRHLAQLPWQRPGRDRRPRDDEGHCRHYQCRYYPTRKNLSQTWHHRPLRSRGTNVKLQAISLQYIFHHTMEYENIMVL